MNDNSEERDTGLPPVGTPEELEEALKWLEDLTARQGKPADLSNPVPAATIDSPFRGLIDSEDGDLPDWLREVPTPLGAEGIEETEPESRLDWLAKMAQRESIEELPTLEWRRLSEPLQSAILADQNIDLPSGDDRELTDETGGSSEPDPVIIEEATTGEVEEASLDRSPGEAPPAEKAEGYTEAEPTEIVTEMPAVTDVTADETEPVEVTQEAVDEYYSSPPPPVDDLDAAMAWIEELAASQDAPIEEVPSVADRALASKLMMEAGLSPGVSPLDELGSDSSLIEGLTPTHPFIEEEDYADTVVLVETLAADQGNALDLTSEPDYGGALAIAHVALSDDEPIVEKSHEPEEVPGDFPAAEELSFEEAMALLDQMAVDQSNEIDETGMVADQGSAETMVDNPFDTSNEIPPAEAHSMEMPEQGEVVGSEFDLAADEAVPWMDDSGTYATTEPLAGEDGTVEPHGQIMIATNGAGFTELEATLLRLDALALPPGKTLDDIDATLRAARTTSWRDVTSALDWLESSLPGKQAPVSSSDLDDAALIAQMPEDPDAVLAWLEGMADEEESRVSASTLPRQESVDVMPSALKPEPLVEDLAEADLLNMPDDPDEAMAWLEGLARDSSPSVESSLPKTVDDLVAGDANVDEHIESEIEVAELIAGEPVFLDVDVSPEIVDETGAYFDQPVIDEQPIAPHTGDMTEISHPDIPAEEYALAEPTLSAEEMSAPEAESTIPDYEPVPTTTREAVEEQPPVNVVADEPMATPARKRSRTRAAKPEADSHTLESPALEVAGEKPVVTETVDEKLADEKPRVPSWLDLLKPLD